MPDFTKRRDWDVAIDGRLRRVTVEYRNLSGFMSIYVDETRVARAWREWQTVFGGAVVAADVDAHRIEARVTQPFAAQHYAFALRVDGQLQPGSDDQPAPGQSKRSTALALVGLVVVVAIVSIAVTLIGR